MKNKHIMLSKFWNKTCEFSKKALTALKNNAIRGAKWAGYDGLLNMETGALMVIFLKVFLPTLWAAAAAFISVLIKSAIDENNGQKGEVHDLVCATVGVTIGVILLAALL